MDKKYKVYSLYRTRDFMPWHGAWHRDTELPYRPERYYSIWNDLKLAWLVFRRKADAIVWEEDPKFYSLPKKPLSAPKE